MYTDSRVALMGVSVRSGAQSQRSSVETEAFANAIEAVRERNARLTLQADLENLILHGSTRFHYASPETRAAIETLVRGGFIREISGKPGHYEHDVP